MHWTSPHCSMILKKNLIRESESNLIRISLSQSLLYRAFHWGMQGAWNGQKGDEVPQGCSWEFNPPDSSHMGGSWEHMIGIARRILDSMFLQLNTHLTHKVLCTLMAEVSAFINAQPLLPVSADPEQPCILSPCSLHRRQEFHHLLDTSQIRTCTQSNGNKVRLLQTSSRSAEVVNTCNTDRSGQYLAETFKLEI